MTKKRTPGDAGDPAPGRKPPGGPPPDARGAGASASHPLPLGLRETLDASSDLIIVAGHDGHLLWLSSAFERLTGLDRAAGTGQPLTKLMAQAETRKIVHYYLKQRHKRSTLMLRDVPLTAAEKRAPHVALRMRFVEGAEGGGLFVGVGRPVGTPDAEPDPLRRRLNGIVALVVEGRASARVRNEFFDTLIDEIRAPMDDVMSMVQLLLGTPLNDEQGRLVQVIRSSSQSLLNLINDTREFSRLEVGELEVAHREFDLRLAIEEVQRQQGPLANEKGLALAIKVDHDVPSRVLGDPGWLRQVLLNLTGAAIRLTEQGEVGLKVTRVEEQEAGVLLRFAVTHAVAKDGVVELNEALEAFQQSDATAGNRFGGARLGLGISRRVILMLGGEVGVEPSGDGSRNTMWFQLELEKQVEKPVHRQEGMVVSIIDQKEIKLEGQLVMVVDSSPTTRKSLVDSLREWGCIPLEAENSALALIQMRKAAKAGRACGAVLIDKELEDGGSYDLARVIRADKALAHTLLLLIAGTGQRGDAASAQAVGFSAYLLKPLQASELNEAMNAVFNNAARGVKELVTRHSLAEARQGRVRLLMVEDSQVDLLVSQWALERQGYSVEVADTAAAALQACERNRYAMVLLDLQLPDGNGYDVVAELRRREKVEGAPHLPVVAITADTQPGTREKCLAAGMDDYLPKPVDLESLSAMVTGYVKLQSEAAPAAAPTAAPAPAKAPASGPAHAAPPPAAPPAAKPAPAAKPPAAEPPRPRRVHALEVGDDDAPGSEGGPLTELDATSVEPLPTLDLARLEEMCMGIPSLRDTLLNTFLAEIGPRLERLIKAVNGADPHQVEVEAHGLRGMLGTIGARAGSEIFGALEALGRGHDEDGARLLLKRAVREADQARRAIESLPFRKAA